MNKNMTRIKKFQKVIWDYFENNRRDFPWRNTTDPYNILVSELMLQQTQASRVVQKYEEFIKKFPDFVSLAEAYLHEVLQEWQGLGYNRRALYLKKAAEIVVKEFDGVLPDVPEELEQLPGIGRATASSIAAFAFNKPTVFIETNIRTVFIHFFFKHRQKISDKELLPYIKQTLDLKNPREWYFALIDYGVMLKKKFPRRNKKSAHYKKQSSFKGSNRELRGQMLKLLLKYAPPHRKISEKFLSRTLNISLAKVRANLMQFKKEGLVPLSRGFLTSRKRPSFSSRHYKTLQKGPMRRQQGEAPDPLGFRDLHQEVPG